MPQRDIKLILNFHLGGWLGRGVGGSSPDLTSQACRILPISQWRGNDVFPQKLRLREVQWLSQGHTAGQW